MYPNYSPRPGGGASLGAFTPSDPFTSHFYKSYRAEEKVLPASFYEKFCMSVPKWAEIPLPFLRKQFSSVLREALLVCSPGQVFTVSFYCFLLAMMVAVFVLTSLPYTPILLGVAVVFPLIVLVGFYVYPFLKIKMDRMAVVGEAPLAILYLVISLRVSPSLEKAVSYASKNVPEPIGREFKFLMWDVELKTKNSMQEAMFAYSARVKKWAPGYSDALYLVTNSVNEPTNKSRLAVLEKAMSQALDNTKGIMENFARGLGLPVAVTNALAILLPVLGLVMAPLASVFMQQAGALPAMLAIVYDFFLPIVLGLIVLVILAGRPATFSDIDIRGDPDLPAEGHYRVKGVGDIPLNLVCLGIFLALSFITILVAINTGGVVFSPNPLKAVGAPMGYNALNTIPLIAAVGISCGIYLYANNVQKLKARDRIQEIEREFAASLFQLGNILEQGKPLEEAFEIAARGMKGTHSAEFFTRTVHNIRTMGMPIRKAIFDPEYGAMRTFSSSLMKNVLGVIIESADSGPIVAAQTTLSISSYVQNIQKVQEKIADNLADSITAMKFQSAVLVPLISAVIVGLTQMVTNILLAMSRNVSDLMSSSTNVGLYSVFSSSLFNIGNVMQGSYLQMVVGYYTLVLLTTLGFFTAGLAYGVHDRIAIQMNVGQSLALGIIIYSVIVFFIVTVFGGLATSLVSQTV